MKHRWGARRWYQFWNNTQTCVRCGARMRTSRVVTMRGRVKQTSYRGPGQALYWPIRRVPPCVGSVATSPTRLP